MPKSSSPAKKSRSPEAERNTIDLPLTPPAVLNGSLKPLGAKIPDPDGETGREKALRRYGITDEQISRCAEISPSINRVLSNAPNGLTAIERVIGFLRFSEDPAALAIVESWDTANPGDRRYFSIEMLCVKTEVNPLQVLGATIHAARQVMAQESALRTIMEHPEVVESTIKFAKALPGAFKDREMIHQAVGYLPTSKGMSMNVNLMGGNPQFSKQEEEGEDDDESFASAFPSLNGDIEQWSNNRHKLLEKGK